MTNNTTPAMQNKTLTVGDRATVWTGETGTVRHLNGEWVGVQIDGERGTHEWQTWQVTAR